MVTEVKMEVTSDLSKRIQEIVFKNGGEWLSTGANILELDKSYLCIDRYKYIYYMDEKQYFNNNKFEKISPCDFIASQGEQKWLPKYGEETLFSNDNKTWKKNKFIFYEPGYKNYYVYNFYKYKYCKPLPKQISFIQFLKDNSAYEKYLYNSKLENQRWFLKSSYKTLEEIKELLPINWIGKAFNKDKQEEEKYFWRRLDNKWEEICENNENIIWE